MSSPDAAYVQLVSLAVHELRTPASVVGGYLRMLQGDTPDALTDRQRKMIDEAEKACARLVSLIGELSDISKLDAGIISLGRQPLDLFALVTEVAGHVHEAHDRGVVLQVRGDGGGARLVGDSGRLRSAFDTIFRAILREKGGPCTVVADRRREILDGRPAAIVAVAADSQIDEALDRPPMPFDDKRGGLGLALPLARRVIEGHGGLIWSPAARGDDDPLARGAALVRIPLSE
jgi:signal transduction histidine kinase